MHDFKYIENQLYCEKIPVQKIASAVGSPLFVYSRKTILDHYNKLHRAFSSVPHTICYSVKSNSNIAICHALIQAGAGLDIVSGGEFFRALKSGAKPKKIVYAGVGKTAAEIRQAIRKGIMFFTVESLPELEEINNIAKRLKKKAPIALRVNPDVKSKTHKYITTGKKGTKFGMDLATCRKIYRNIKKYPFVKPVGIQIHIGSQITETKPYIKALKKIIPLVKELKRSHPTMKYLDIGGGFGIIYNKEKATSAQDFAKAIIPLVKKLHLHLVIEPGRFIAGNAGILVTKVTYVKETPPKNFVIVNAAMNDLIRPSLYHAYHQIVPVIKHKGKSISTDVVGPICESGDFFAKNRKLVKPRAGQLLAIMSAGAYGFSMSSNYNSRPRAAEVMVDNNVYYIIRNRETYKDLIRGEHIPSWRK